MFVALEIIEEPPKGIFGGLLNILTMPKVELELRKVLDVRYIAAQTTRTRRGINWEEIIQLCSRYSDRILLPEGVEPPEEAGFSAPALPRFERQVLTDTACEIIERSKMPMYRRMLGLADATGEYAGMLEPLLKHYTSVRVVTENVERYEQEASRMMEELGAPVLVGSEWSGLSDCVLLLSPKPFRSMGEDPLPPVLAGSAFAASGPCDCITRLEVSPNQEIRNNCPAGILPHLFAGALFECCGAKEIPTVADRMLYNHKVADLDEVVRMVLYRAGYTGLFS